MVLKDGLAGLTVLNLNGNQLQILPPEIGCLIKLETLSIDNNRLIELPKEIGLLPRLSSLSLAGNKISKLPREMTYLYTLESLILIDNRLKDVPMLLSCRGLKHFDVSLNKIHSFDVRVLHWKIPSFFFERNPLQKPVKKQPKSKGGGYYIQPHSLKELAMRFIALKVPSQHVCDDTLRGKLRAMGTCAACKKPFHEECVDAVEFMDMFHGKNTINVPVQRQLCSEVCFMKNPRYYHQEKDLED